MNLEDLRKLKIGDRIKKKSGCIYYVLCFGRFNGKYWIRSGKSKANGIWGLDVILDINKFTVEYISAHQIESKITM